MSTLIKRSLTLVPNNAPVGSGNQAKNSIEDPEVWGPGTLSLLESRSAGTSTNDGILKFLSLLNNVNPKGSLVVLSNEVTITLENNEGDASICFVYDIANYSFKPLESRPHRYWFTTPQEKVVLRAFDQNNEPLKIEEVESTSNFSEIRVLFPKPLKPSDRVKYRVEFSVKKDFFKGNYYDIMARTVTNRITFTVLAPENIPFDEKKVELESADGSLQEKKPLLSLSFTGTREKLTWSQRHPKIGDQFRTYWTLA